MMLAGRMPGDSLPHLSRREADGHAAMPERAA